MKKMVVFFICLLAALALNFLREGITSRVHAQLQKGEKVKAEEPKPVSGKSYPAPDSTKVNVAYPVSGKNDPGSGSYPAPVSRPAEKKVK